MKNTPPARGKATASPPRKLFGTDGIRGRAGLGDLSPGRLVKIGRAVGALLLARPELFFRKNAPNAKKRARPLVVVGGDTRLSRDMVQSAFCAGLLRQGADVVNVGVMPTPAIALLATLKKAGAGVVVSASHNPFEDNGVKVFGSDGYKISEAAECAIERWVAEPEKIPRLGDAGAIGRSLENGEAREQYMETLVARFMDRLRLRGRKIVVDCAHGAMSAVAPEVFRRLGAKVTVLHDAPDGVNINEGCGALHPETLQKPVLREAGAVGFSFDGDGDRVMAVDDKGRVRDGDFLMAILGRHLAGRRRLAKNTVVGTVMSNLGLELALREDKIKLLRAPVGDKYVAEEILKHDYSFGGEQSGHLIFHQESTTGDGLLSALCLLEVMRETGDSLSRLSGAMEKCPQTLLNVRVRRKPEFDDIDGLRAAVRGVERALHGNGRLVLRYSGTEPLARVMIEGRNQREIEDHARSIAAVIRRAIGGEKQH